MIYLIIGLIYAIIMVSTTLKVLQAPLSLKTFNVLCFTVGGLIIFAIKFAKKKLKNKK